MPDKGKSKGTTSKPAAKPAKGTPAKSDNKKAAPTKSSKKK